MKNPGKWIQKFEPNIGSQVSDGYSVVVSVIVVAVLDHVDRATFEHLSELTDSFKGFKLRRSPDQKAVSLGGSVDLDRVAGHLGETSGDGAGSLNSLCGVCGHGAILVQLLSLRLAETGSTEHVVTNLSQVLSSTTVETAGIRNCGKGLILCNVVRCIVLRSSSATVDALECGFSSFGVGHDVSPASALRCERRLACVVCMMLVSDIEVVGHVIGTAH